MTHATNRAGRAFRYWEIALSRMLGKFLPCPCEVFGNDSRTRLRQGVDGPCARVVHEDLGLADVVSVDALDTEVIGQGLAGRARVETGNSNLSAVGAEDLLASRELIGALEPLIGDRPERMVL